MKQIRTDREGIHKIIYIRPNKALVSTKTAQQTVILQLSTKTKLVKLHNVFKAEILHKINNIKVFKTTSED